MNASLLPLVPALPLIGAVVNGLLRARVSRVVTGSIASAAVGGSAVLSFLALFELLGQHGEGAGLQHTVYTWISAGTFQADVGFLVDPLSATMMCVVTGVGFLIHVYSIGYMDDAADTGSVWRYFCYLNLFLFSMLLLIMGDNFLLMFVGWEGVGACSYLLIGFWFSDTANAIAGKKAFVVNRIGDFCFVLGLFWLFWSLGTHATINFQELAHVLHDHPGLVGGVGGAVATGVCLLFFGGATGKSAQIPLYVWLPDAMAGPTPVSALIHAATMVTAGVYMLCRLNFLFVLSPVAMGVVALVGAMTALVAATIAVSQYDIKKVLAYSTVSQLGYMVLAAGMGAYSAAFFHVMTHAFFKALLFLGAGSIIHALHHEQDMRNMGGLRKFMPVTFWTFTAAYLAIIGFPGFAGFFSKDEILWLTFSTPAAQVPLFGEGFPLPTVLWAVGFVTAILTAFYMSRLYFMTFFGAYRGGGHGEGDHGDGDHAHGEPHESPAFITVPLVILAVLSVVGGVFNLPHWMPGAGKLHHFLEPSLEAAHHALAPAAEGGLEFPLMGITLAAIAASVAFAWSIYGRGGKGLSLPDRVVNGSRNLWYVDEFYEAALLKPIHKVSRKVLWAVVDVKIIDGLVNGVAHFFQGLASLYSRRIHVGQTQAYALSIALGSAVLVLFYALG